MSPDRTRKPLLALLMVWLLVKGRNVTPPGPDHQSQAEDVAGSLSRGP